MFIFNLIFNINILSQSAAGNSVIFSSVQQTILGIVKSTQVKPDDLAGETVLRHIQNEVLAQGAVVANYFTNDSFF